MRTLLHVVDYALIYMFYDRTFTRKELFQKKYCAFLHGIFCILLFFITDRMHLYHGIATCIVIIVTSFYYEENIHTKGILICFFLVMEVLSKFLAIGLLGNLFHQGMKRGIITISRLQLEDILADVFRYIFLLIWCDVNRSKKRELSRKEREIIFSMLMITIMGNCLLYYFLFRTKYLDPFFIFTVVLMISFGIHYFMIQMLEVMNQWKIENYENRLMIQEQKIEEAYFYELKDKIKELRRLRHDYKNQLMALLAVKWNDEEHLEEEIKHFINRMEQSENIIYSENYVINAICKSKFMEAGERNIKVLWKVMVPVRINMRCDEMGVLFGNLLDNAIEACEKVSCEPSIDFRVTVKDEKMIIQIQNTRNEMYILEEGKKTTKEDEEHHGFGLESIRSIVDKYNGSMCIKEEKELYRTEILMYGIHQSL